MSYTYEQIIYIQNTENKMFIEFSNELINTHYILKFYLDGAKVDNHPRPFFIKLKMIDEKLSENEDCFENFETGEECNERYEELNKFLTPRVMHITSNRTADGE